MKIKNKLLLILQFIAKQKELKSLRAYGFKQGQAIILLALHSVMKRACTQIFNLENAMNWENYVSQFNQRAKQQDHDDAYIQRCLTYAHQLYAKNVSIIYDQKHLSLLVGYAYHYLRAASQTPQRFYRYFEIPKLSGGTRKIAEPLPSLKQIQNWLLQNILNRCQPSRYAKAFFPGRSIKENARFHCQQSHVLALDLEDFFNSIDAAKVYQFYKKLGYRKSVAILLTRLCTLNNALPQGAPTSPALSNLVSIRLDKRLAGYAVKNQLRYTRYADDLTFSGNLNANKIIYFVKEVLKEEKLKLNNHKIKLMPSYKRQEVTGIVVNEKMQVPRPLRRELKQAIYYINRYGLESHMQQKIIRKANYLQYLLGITNFILFVNPADKGAADAYSILLKKITESSNGNLYVSKLNNSF